MKKKNTLDIRWFKGKKVVVFGIEESGGGVSAIKFLVANGAHVIATDIKSKETLKKSLKEIKDLKNVTLVLGQYRRENFIHADMVIKTPSCSWTNEYIRLALNNDIPVETDASLFLKLCKNKIIGITGTKGKTTVSHMVSHFLKSTGYHAIQIGVGATPVLDRLELLKKNSVVVFELSSRRLSALKFAKISPTISVLTSFFSDHMNYYSDIEKYWNDKKQIFKYQKKDDFFVFNADDESIVERLDGLELDMNKVAISVKNNKNLEIFVEDDTAFINKNNKIKEIAKLSDMRVIGEHNKRNMLLAIGAVASIGGSVSKIRRAVKLFLPIKYRLEHIKTLCGIEYYNDTTATNPGAATMALESFQGKNIILIAGGSDRKLEVKDFARQIVDKVEKVFFFKGTYSDRLIAEIKKLEPREDLTNYKLYESMHDIIEDIGEVSEGNDVVLLSPGAPSSSVYKNEFERGEEFVTEIEKLKK